MKIFIFMMDRELLNKLREETKKLLLWNRQEAKIFSFYNLDPALKELEDNHSSFNLVILDIDFVQDLKHIYTNFRAHNLLASIIFISSSYKMTADYGIPRQVSDAAKVIVRSCENMHFHLEMLSGYDE